MADTPIGAARPSAALGDRAAILATVLLWGMQVPALHALGARWDPFTLNLLRYLLAAAAFAILFRIGARRPPTRLALRRAAMLGGLMAGFGILFTTAAMVGDPVAIATTGALMPLTASLVNWALIGGRPRRRLVAALALVIPGAALATPASGESGGHPLFGMALMMGAQVSWAVYSLCAERWTPNWSPAARTAVSVNLSLPWHLAAFAAAVAAGAAVTAPWPTPASDATLIVGVTLGPLVVGVVFWNLSVARLGLPFAALHLNLVPVVAIGLAAMAGAAPTGMQMLGAALVISAMAVAGAPRGLRKGQAS